MKFLFGNKEESQPKSSFSAFFVKSSSGEQKKVLEGVVRKSSEQQKTILEEYRKLQKA